MNFLREISDKKRKILNNRYNIYCKTKQFKGEQNNEKIFSIIVSGNHGIVTCRL